MERTTVINGPLIIRSLFPTENPLPKAGVMAVGDEVKVIGKLQGDAINGNNLWFLDEHRDFIWSGDVAPVNHGQLPTYGQSLKMTFTCDDYGAVDTIDDGIYELAANGQIDCVECFINGPNCKDRLRRLFQLKKDGKKLDLGIHLTITSGKPMSNDSGSDTEFVKENGDFIDWHLYFKSIIEDGIDWLVEEIKTQIDTARKWEGELCEELGLTKPVFTHLSSHHNALAFYESGFKEFIKIASDYQYAIRAPLVQPKLKSNIAMKIKVTINALSGKRLLKLLNEFNETASWPVPHMDYIDMRHYGPALREVTQKKFDRWIKKKTAKKEEILSKLIKSGKNHVEVILHVRKGTIHDLALKKRKKYKKKARAKFKKELSNNDANRLYSGIDIKYFDGRTLEYHAMKSKFDRNDYKDRSFLAQEIDYVHYP